MWYRHPCSYKCTDKRIKYAVFSSLDTILYQVLQLHFQNFSDVYISGNLFIYYEQGNPESVVAPDVFVVFGVKNHQRRSYKTWEENNKTPDFILEITSFATRSKDQGAKKGIYAFLGVK